MPSLVGNTSVFGDAVSPGSMSRHSGSYPTVWLWCQLSRRVDLPAVGPKLQASVPLDRFLPCTESGPLTSSFPLPRVVACQRNVPAREVNLMRLQICEGFASLQG